MKKLFALLLAVIMVLGLVGCNVANDNPTTDPKDNTTAGSNNTTGGNDVTTAPASGVQFPLEEEVTFQIVASANTRAQNDLNAALENNKLWQDLYKRTNVKIEIIELTGDDKVGTLNALIQAGKQGDACFGWNAGVDLNALMAMAGNNLLVPLDEYMDDKELMPNLNERVFEASNGVARAVQVMPDGKSYSLPSFQQDIPQYLESSLWINKAWLDKANMDVPTTFEELEAALEYFRNNDMNGNGDPNDEIPYFCWQQFGYSTIEAILGMWGIPTKDVSSHYYAYVQNGEVIFAPETEAWKDWIQTLNKWWEKGWMYKGCFTDDYATQKSHWNGEGVSEIGLMTNNAAPKRNPDEYVCIVPPAAMEGVDVNWFYMAGANGTPSQAFFVFKDCENVDILMAWIDQFYSWEVTQRNYYGEFGSAWCMETAEGKVLELTPNDDAQEANFKVNSKLYEILGNLPRAVTAEDFEKRIEKNDTMLSRDTAYELYKDVINDEPWPKPFFDAEDTDRLNEILTDVYQVMRNNRANWITGRTDVDAEWDQYIQQLKDIGIDEVVEILQTSYDRYLDGMN
ncbi:MAG: extracellular solute-binding protein [Oscillospiraceae bacterium]|nr:extracellular solute-binding protein [Oscillospiraceae bacterium]